jgi:hypothetical protein
MLFRLFSAMILLVLVGCASPHVVPASQDKNFRLADLTAQRIAVFPIATAELDESSSKTVAEEYKEKGAFLDALSARFSARLVGLCKAPSLGSEKVLSILSASGTTQPLLDPTKVLGAQDPNNRFAGGASLTALTALSQLPELGGIRYAVIARDLGIGRQWSNHATAGGGFVSTGPGGAGTFVGGGSSSSAKTSARLRLAIVDLETKAIVWDGAIFADASSTFMKATALHEVEEDLTAHFINEILGIK